MRTTLTRQQFQYLTNLLVFNFQLAALRLRRVFNSLCLRHTSFDDWRHYRAVQKLFDTIDRNLFLISYYNPEPSSFVHEQESKFRFIHFDTIDNEEFHYMNDLLFKIDFRTRWLLTKYLRLHERFTELANDFNVIYNLMSLLTGHYEHYDEEECYSSRGPNIIVKQIRELVRLLQEF